MVCDKEMAANLELAGVNNIQSLINSLDVEFVIEYGIPSETDEDIFFNTVLESGDYTDLLSYIEESNRRMSKKEYIRMAKRKAFEKFKKSKKYKRATYGLSNSEKRELDRRLNKEMDRRENEATSVWVKHPYSMTFLCLFFLGILGVFVAMYYLNKHAEERIKSYS